ncbi:long-chain-fatty-acid--CoA ligase [Marinobacter sp. M1N3S26]|uniref:long-chain-fatty-acid--CoA ligase n=1 Tax=unclassified Marinobacter TaxID=83889 RepID=UPI00387B4970
MHGLMMQRPLLISQILEFAAGNYPDQEIVSRTTEGPIHRYTYPELAQRTRKLANALKKLGVTEEDRIGTIAWNTYRHLEIYYASSGMGAICHTMNPRLPAEQFIYIINHAKDKFIFVDLTFLPLMEKLHEHFPDVEGYIVMTDEEHMPQTDLPRVYCYETLIKDEPDQFEWPEFDENTASSLCYTSGTTGNPKGVLYSHRSNVLHALFALTVSGLPLDERSTILPVVPMFHVNAWGTPYFGLIAGTKLVFPGPGLDGENLANLIEDEKVTDAWGVPTVWLGLLGYMKKAGKKFSTLTRTLIGGSAVPKSMIEDFRDNFGVEAIQGWGMTEMSPLGTVATPRPSQRDGDWNEELRLRASQGRLVFGVEMKIVDAEGKELPHDGESQGELLVRGNAVISGYYENPEATKKALDKDGWFHTGDVSVITPDGFMEIVDRVKDVIKSGGEWISSIDLENEAIAHPGLAEAAVIGVRHEKWQERPLLVAVKNEDADVTREDVLKFLEERVAKWWLPDDVVFVDELPHGATGKLQKAKLRDDFKDYRLPTE